VADVSWKPAAHWIVAFLRTRCSRSEVDVPNGRSNLRVVCDRPRTGYLVNADGNLYALNLQGQLLWTF